MATRILNVDVDDARRERDGACFRRAAYDVAAAANAAAALASALDVPPDIVLIHGRLPDMEPLDLARRIRQEPAARTAVIVHVADGADGAAVAAFAAGVDLVVAAALGETELLGVIDAARDRARLLHQAMREERSVPHDSARGPHRGVGQPPAQTFDGEAQPDTILVVDDERAIRRLAEGILQRAGYSVVTKGSAEAALEWWREHRTGVALVVTDVVMPGATGPEMLAAMRRDRPQLAAIVMSGYVAEGNPAAIPARADMFLHKPFTPDELRSAVRDALSEASQ